MESFAPFTSVCPSSFFFLAEISSKLTFFAQIEQSFGNCGNVGNTDLLQNDNHGDNDAISCAPLSKVFSLSTDFNSRPGLVGSLCTLPMWAFNSSSEYQLSRQWSHFELRIIHTSDRDWWCLHKGSVIRADVCSWGAPQCTERNMVKVIFLRELAERDWRLPDTDKGHL